METPAGSHLEVLLESQRDLASALASASDLLSRAGPELEEAATNCRKRAEDLFCNTAEVVQGYAESAEEVLCLMQPGSLSKDGSAGADLNDLAAIGQKTHAAYEELEKEVDSLVMRLSFTETGVRRPLLEAARAPTWETLPRGQSSCGGLLGAGASTSSAASTAASDEEAVSAAAMGLPAYESEGSNSDCDCTDGSRDHADVEKYQKAKDIPCSFGDRSTSASEASEPDDSEVLLRALASAQEAGLAARGCCAALVSICALLRKQLLMKENIQCLLDSCARSPALRRRCQQRLDEHAAVWQALAASSHHYCDSHKATRVARQ
uniref:Uncharacterized protein n=1 Tax=Alexandrium catenella TaxID=2925 RepID=A0A7S1M2J8_ALECA